MIGECLVAQRPFGIIRAVENGIADLGCTAEITDVTKRYDDGRMDIETLGRERFEIVVLNEERSFLQGEIVVLEDEPDEPEKDEVVRALELHTEVAQLSGVEAEPPAPDEAAAHRQLSYELAAALPLDLDLKQTLLSIRSEAQRIGAMIKIYEAVLPKLRLVEDARKKAGGNGKIHH
jgi:Lon protease-like protein